MEMVFKGWERSKFESDRQAVHVYLNILCAYVSIFTVSFKFLLFYSYFLPFFFLVSLEMALLLLAICMFLLSF